MSEMSSSRSGLRRTRRAARQAVVVLPALAALLAHEHTYVQAGQAVPLA